MADPLSIAASAVGIISLGIQVVQSIYQYYSAAKDQHSDIARTLRKLEDLQVSLERLQAHLQDRKFQPSEEALLQNIHSTIKRCEECIRDLERESKEFEKRPIDSVRAAVGGTVRWLQYPFRESTLLKLNEDIDDLISQLSLALSLLQQQTIDRVQDEIESANAILALIRTSQVSSEIRAWVQAPDATFNFTEACAKKHPGTGNWFVKGPEFMHWLEDPSSFLWLKGFAGCGKTVLSSTVIQHTLRHRRSNPRIGLCFFFFSFNDKSKQDVSAMLRALILQLSDQLAQTPTALQRIYDMSKKHNVSPTSADLLRCFHQLVELFQHVHVVLDALDESPRETNRYALLEVLKEIRAWSEPRLHLLVTSRDEVDIRAELEAAPQHTILMQNDGINDDIAEFVSQHLRRRLKRWSKHHSQIEKILTEKAHGVFRWVECQFKALETCPRSKQALDRQLQSLPPTLDETYKRMLENVSDKDYAKQMLTILCCATRPLTVPELVNAMAIEIGITSFFNPDRQLQDADALQEICPGFTEVFVDSESNMSVIRIAHFSVQEYLESDRILQPEGCASFSLRKRCGNLMLASMCLTLLLVPELPTLQRSEIYQKYPFTEYAAEEWPDHWRKSNEIDARLASRDDFSCCPPETSHSNLVLRLQEQMVLLFRNTNGAMRNWIQIWDIDAVLGWTDQSMDPSPLYYASHVGALFLVESLYEDWEKRCYLDGPTKTRIDVMDGPGSHGTALQAAAAMGHIDVVQFWLNKGADPNMNVAQTLIAEGTPLMTASAHGQTKIIELLLKHGAAVNAMWTMSTDEIRRTTTIATALAAASSEGHEEAVKVLLKHGALDDVHPIFLDGSALMASHVQLSEQSRRIKKMLLQNFDGTRVTTSSQIFESYLEVAAEDGNKELVQKFLDKWILCGKPGFPFGKSLQMASAFGHLQIVHLLIQSGANVNDLGRVLKMDGSVRNSMGTALEEASAKGHNDIIELLLLHKADIKLLGRGGQGTAFGSALQRALAAGHQETVRLLLDVGNPSDQMEMPELYAASLVGSEETVQALLDSGVDINARYRGERFQTALSAACMGGYIKIVEMLLDRGASLEVGDDEPAEDGFKESLR
ncbi:hypothetical protein CORC01_10551 [Colletotrichum orchidophilum]|uniref:NACHT domain-containing protein n=1 Tax=Colletotrichum orchidophilum TaxID=1209926 RepID=A0A1G4AY74_9PEZI|nr:uncharacterized protein CORC01_10551 [Colletotrichum orchidophilum]OHE94094.1 hypothetical protein CORC01_10551 [Colletotrichum orchidophilum]